MPAARTAAVQGADPRISWIALGVVAGITTAAHILGAGPMRGTLWGSHFYAFLPASAVAISALSVLTVLAGLRYGSWIAHGPMGSHLPAHRWPTTRSALAVLGVLVSFAVFWLFRSGHTLWGDGRPLTLNVPAGERFHPLEPLTAVLQHYVYGAGRPLFQSLWTDSGEVARNAIALGSALAGALFMPVAWALARSFAGRRRSGHVVPLDEGALSTVPLVFLVLVGQGYIQLFFGYVENYTFYTLALGLYFLAAHRFLEGRAPLILPAAALILAMTLHLSAASMAPSFVALAVIGLVARSRRTAIVRDLAICAALFAAISLALSWLSPGYQLGRTLWSVVGRLGRDSVAIDPGYLLSAQHLRDFLNEQLLIGPLGLFLFVPVALASLISPARRDPGVIFSIVAGAGYLAACWIAGDSNLGYSRNWDLLAPAGFVFVAASLYLVLHARWTRVQLNRWLLVGAAVSMLHTVPWIAMNTSFQYSFARLKTLPLGLGRTESIVGTWHLRMGEQDEAAHWFERSLAAYPGNYVAAYYLGEIGMNREDYRAAATHYAAAVGANPTKELYRSRLAEALIRAGNPAAAKAHLDTLVWKNAAEPSYWVGYGIVWNALGRPEIARVAFERARELAPLDTTLAALSDRMSATRDYRGLLREHRLGLIGAGP
jgi:hypothetical protein